MLEKKALYNRKIPDLQKNRKDSHKEKFMEFYTNDLSIL